MKSTIKGLLSFSLTMAVQLTVVSLVTMFGIILVSIILALHVGAAGLTQIMPKFAPEFAKACGLGDIEPKDIYDSQINLLIGACRFRELMAYYSGDPTLALAAYNSGVDSQTVRKTASSDVRSANQETIGYLAAAFVMQQKLLTKGNVNGRAANK